MRALLPVTLAAVILAAAFAAPAEAAFGLLPGAEGFSVAVLRTAEKEEREETLAGAHPFEVRASFRFNAQAGRSEGDLRNLRLSLPAGLVENPRAVFRCSGQQFETPRSSPLGPSLSGESCPGAAQVGVLTLAGDRAGGEPVSFGLFNLEPPPGAPSELGAAPFGEAVRLRHSISEESGS